jgi:hypothetical protein
MQSFIAMLETDKDYLPAILGMSTGFMIERSQHKARNLLKRVAKMEVPLLIPLSLPLPHSPSLCLSLSVSLCLCVSLSASFTSSRRHRSRLPMEKTSKRQIYYSRSSMWTRSVLSLDESDGHRLSSVSLHRERMISHKTSARDV